MTRAQRVSGPYNSGTRSRMTWVPGARSFQREKARFVLAAIATPVPAGTAVITEPSGEQITPPSGHQFPSCRSL